MKTNKKASSLFAYMSLLMCVSQSAHAFVSAMSEIPPGSGKFYDVSRLLLSNFCDGHNDDKKILLAQARHLYSTKEVSKDTSYSDLQSLIKKCLNKLNYDEKSLIDGVCSNSKRQPYSIYSRVSDKREYSYIRKLLEQHQAQVAQEQENKNEESVESESMPVVVASSQSENLSVQSNSAHQNNSIDQATSTGIQAASIVDPMSTYPSYVFKNMDEIRKLNIDLKFNADTGEITARGLLPEACLGKFGFRVDDLDSDQEYKISAEFDKSAKASCNEQTVAACNRWTCVDLSKVPSSYLFDIERAKHTVEATDMGIRLKKTGTAVFVYDDPTKPEGPEAIIKDSSLKLEFVDEATRIQIADAEAQEAFNMHMAETCEAAMGGDVSAIAELESLGANSDFVKELNSQVENTELAKLESGIDSLSSLKDAEKLIDELTKMSKEKGATSELKSKIAADLSSIVAGLSSLDDGSDDSSVTESKKLSLAKKALRTAKSLDSKNSTYRLAYDKILLDIGMNGAKSGDSFAYNTAMKDAQAGARDISSLYNKAVRSGEVSPELAGLASQYKQQFAQTMMPQVPTLNQMGYFPNPIGTMLDYTFLSSWETNAKAQMSSQQQNNGTMNIAQQYQAYANPSTNPYLNVGY